MEMDQQLLELPLESMPRERLEKLGAKSLETYELLAILLRTGSRVKCTTISESRIKYV